MIKGKKNSQFKILTYLQFLLVILITSTLFLSIFIVTSSALDSGGKPLYIFDYDETIQLSNGQLDPDAVAGIKQLINSGQNIGICSKNSNSNHRLEEDLAKIDPNYFNPSYFESDAFQVDTDDKTDDLAEIITYFDADKSKTVFYDDNPSNAPAAANNGIQFVGFEPDEFSESDFNKGMQMDGSSSSDTEVEDGDESMVTDVKLSGSIVTMLDGVVEPFAGSVGDTEDFDKDGWADGEDWSPTEYDPSNKMKKPGDISLEVDIDQDGIRNDIDGDMDGDGKLNYADDDIDGDEKLNEDDVNDDGDGLVDGRDTTPGGRKGTLDDYDFDDIPNSEDEDDDGDEIPDDEDYRPTLFDKENKEPNPGDIAKEFDEDQDGIRNGMDEDYQDGTYGDGGAQPAAPVDVIKPDEETVGTTGTDEPDEDEATTTTTGDGVTDTVEDPYADPNAAPTYDELVAAETEGDQILLEAEELVELARENETQKDVELEAAGGNTEDDDDDDDDDDDADEGASDLEE